MAGSAMPKASHADLVELPVAPLLRPLAAEHGPDVEPLLRSLDVRAVLDVGAHGPGRALGTEGELLLALVLEDVHLLVDDVRRLADAAGEEGVRLDHRRADLAVAVQREDLAGHPLDLLPAPDLAGQDVVHPLDAVDLHAAGSRPRVRPGQTGGPPMGSPTRTRAPGDERGGEVHPARLEEQDHRGAHLEGAQFLPLRDRDGRGVVPRLRPGPGAGWSPARPGRRWPARVRPPWRPPPRWRSRPSGDSSSVTSRSLTVKSPGTFFTEAGFDRPELARARSASRSRAPPSGKWMRW